MQENIIDRVHQVTDEIRETYPEINYSIRLKFQSDPRHKDGFSISSTDYPGLFLDQYTSQMLDNGVEPGKTDVPAFCLLKKGERFSLAIAVDNNKDYCQSAIIAREIIQKLTK